MLLELLIDDDCCDLLLFLMLLFLILPAELHAVREYYLYILLHPEISIKLLLLLFIFTCFNALLLIFVFTLFTLDLGVADLPFYLLLLSWVNLLLLVTLLWFGLGEWLKYFVNDDYGVCFYS